MASATETITSITNHITAQNDNKPELYKLAVEPTLL